MAIFTKKIIWGAVGVLCAAITAVFIFNTWPPYDSSCITKTQNDKVIGTSLEPFMKNGTIIRAQYGYYSCNDVEKGDVVLIKYTGSENALIKIVKAVPGDKFELKQAEGDTWNILINNEILKNSAGVAYSFSDQHAQNLKLYATDYKNILPINSYLVLGDQPAGTTDSTVFGPIPKETIIAKVI